MKVRDCRRCREEIAKQAKEEYLNHEFDIFEDVARSMAIYAVSGLLTTMIRRGRTAEYVKKLYDDMINVFNTDSFFGKKQWNPSWSHIPPAAHSGDNRRNPQRRT